MRSSGCRPSTTATCGAGGTARPLGGAWSRWRRASNARHCTARRRAGRSRHLPGDAARLRAQTVHALRDSDDTSCSRLAPALPLDASCAARRPAPRCLPGAERRRVPSHILADGGGRGRESPPVSGMRLGVPATLQQVLPDSMFWLLMFRAALIACVGNLCAWNNRSFYRDVRVVKKLPEDVLLHYNHNIGSIPNMRTKAYSSPNHYVQKVLPKLLELGAVRIAPFSNKLAQLVPSNIQALRASTVTIWKKSSGSLNCTTRKEWLPWSLQRCHCVNGLRLSMTLALSACCLPCCKPKMMILFNEVPLIVL